MDTKCSLHPSVNFMFLTKLVNSLLTGNDLCHSHSMHCKVTETNACCSNSFIVVQWRHISSESAVIICYICGNVLPVISNVTGNS